MSRVRVVTATPAHEAFYQEMCRALKMYCDRHPEIRNFEIIAVLGRMAGTCIAMAYPDERDLARQMAIVNLDQAVEDLAPPGPDRRGVRQS